MESHSRSALLRLGSVAAHVYNPLHRSPHPLKDDRQEQTRKYECGKDDDWIAQSEQPVVQKDVQQPVMHKPHTQRMAAKQFQQRGYNRNWACSHEKEHEYDGEEWIDRAGEMQLCKNEKQQTYKEEQTFVSAKPRIAKPLWAFHEYFAKSVPNRNGNIRYIRFATNMSKGLADRKDAQLSSAA